MNLESLARSIGEHPFFAQLSPTEIDFLAGCTKNCRFEAGEYLFREGKPADHIYLLRSGEVDLESHAAGRGPIALERLHAGEALGISAVLSPHNWSIDARAVTSVLTFAVDGPCLRNKIEVDPSFGCAVLKRLLHDTHVRLDRARLHQLDIYKAELRGPTSAP